MQTISKHKLEKLAWIETEIRKIFNDKLWFQHNRYSVSPFSRTEQEFVIIQNFIDNNPEMFEV